MEKDVNTKKIFKKFFTYLFLSFVYIFSVINFLFMGIGFAVYALCVTIDNKIFEKIKDKIIDFNTTKKSENIDQQEN